MKYTAYSPDGKEVEIKTQGTKGKKKESFLNQIQIVELVKID